MTNTRDLSTKQILIFLNRHKKFFNKKENTYHKRWSNWLRLYSPKKVRLQKYIQKYLKLKLVNSVQEVKKVIHWYNDAAKFYDRRCLTEIAALSLIRQAKQVSKERKKQKQSNARDIVTITKWQDAVKACEHNGEELLFLNLLFRTGRRSIDLKRLQYSDVKIAPNKLVFFIRGDKTNTSRVSFSIEEKHPLENTWEMLPFQEIKSQLLACKERTGPIFDNLSRKKLSKKLGFNLHGLRRLATLELLSRGMSKVDVADKIGWSCLRMVDHYARVSSTVAGQLGCISEMLSWIE